MPLLNRDLIMSDKINNVLENGYLKLGTAVVVIVAVIRFTYFEMSYRSELDTKIDRIERKLSEMKVVLWSDQDMMIWVLRAKNAGYDSLPDIALDRQAFDKLFPDR